MNIICAFSDDGVSYLEPGPVSCLSKHNVSIVNKITDLGNMIQHSYRNVEIEQFPTDPEIILSDRKIPDVFNRYIPPKGDVLEGRFVKENCMCPVILFLSDLFTCDSVESSIKKIGLFLPKKPREDEDDGGFDYSVGGIRLIGSRECWTPQGFRDWEKLLSLFGSEG